MLLLIVLVFVPIFWCFSCCCLRGNDTIITEYKVKSNSNSESQLDPSIELPTVSTQESNYVGDGLESRTPAFAKRPKRKRLSINDNNNGDDCCAGCCCCCGRICGIVCGFLGLILSIISLFFAIFACANVFYYYISNLIRLHLLDFLIN